MSFRGGMEGGRGIQLVLCFSGFFARRSEGQQGAENPPAKALEGQHMVILNDPERSEWENEES